MGDSPLVADNHEVGLRQDAAFARLAGPSQASNPPADGLHRPHMRQLDACLGVLEDAHERGLLQVSASLAKHCWPTVPQVQQGMLISDAIELVFREQAIRMRPTTGLKAGLPVAHLRAGDHVYRSATEVGSGIERNAPSPKLTPADARELTDRIKSGLGHVSLLLLEAHDKKAWSPLGCKSWSHYVRSEFGISRSRSYELLDHARVLQAVTSAAQMSGIPDISPYASHEIRPRLGQLTAEIRAQSCGLPESRVQAIVAELVRNARAKPADLGLDQAHPSRPALARMSPVPQDAADGGLVRLVERLARLPAPREVADSLSAKDAARLRMFVPRALQWLDDLATALSASERVDRRSRLAG